jgi:dihydroorotate dehydrogenase
MSEALLQRLLSALPPETAHAVALTGLDTAAHLPGWRSCVADQPRLLWGLRFAHPVALAAGLDKNADHIEGLGALGFAAIEIGTVTPRPQGGNPRPRLFRIPERRALINRMGFNNKGVDYAAERLARRRYTGIVGANIGKNRETPLEDALDDYRYCLERVHGVADYVTVNVSSPNTPGLRDLQSGAGFERLLGGLVEARERLEAGGSRHVPLLIKIAPDIDGDGVARIADGVRRHGIDGVIATNTTADHRPVADCRHGDEAGGLSGTPLHGPATATVHDLATALDGQAPVIGVGGILDGGDARAKIDAGAELVQLYTGLIYRGPGIAKSINEGLLALMDDQGFETVEDAVGAGIE